MKDKFVKYLKGNYLKIIPFIAIIIYLLIQGKKSEDGTRKVLNNMVIVPSKVINFDYGGNGGSMITYQFSYNKKKYTYKGYSRYINWGGKNSFLKASFPVALAKDEPENYKILIIPSDFKSLGLSFPDSLKWVLKYEQP